MTLSYPLSLPNTRFAELRLRARSVVSMSRSPTSGVQQVQAHPGQWWEAEAALPMMTRAQAEPWEAFALALNGRENTFLLGNPLNDTPRGIGGGSPLVNGGGQTGGSLNIDGAPVSTTGWLKAGDMLQLGTGAASRLYKLLEDADTDAGGTATLSIWPNLRSSPADNAAVIITSARGVFRLNAGSVEWTTGVHGMVSLGFSAMETVDGT